MIVVFLIPFLVQALAIGFDECYFHLKRGLPKWERIGHPIDTLIVAFCLLFVLLVPYSPLALKWYIALGIVSCLVITKDEWVHKEVCPPSEQWLHALLFINHPLLLISVGCIWRTLSAFDTAPMWLKSYLNEPAALYSVLVGQTVAIFLFFLYQVIYWNFIWKENKTRS